MLVSSRIGRTQPERVSARDNQALRSVVKVDETMSPSGSSDGLRRFVKAQDLVYADVLGELTAARERTHWMWFVFLQLKGLGQSATALHYGFESVDEARAYLLHPVLGRRLSECTELVLRTRDKSAHDIFGSPVALKLKSCMTLFGEAAGAEPLFREVLGRSFDGRTDARTGALLKR